MTKATKRAAKPQPEIFQIEMPTGTLTRIREAIEAERLYRPDGDHRITAFILDALDREFGRRERMESYVQTALAKGIDAGLEEHNADWADTGEDQAGAMIGRVEIRLGRELVDEDYRRDSLIEAAAV